MSVEVAPAGGALVAQVSLAVDGSQPWTTVPVTVQSSMTPAQMLAALRAAIAGPVQEYLRAAAVKTSLVGQSGLEAF